jgi:cytosine deaminase
MKCVTTRRGSQLDRCLDLITYNGAKTLNVEDQYGIEEGKPANS